MDQLLLIRVAEVQHNSIKVNQVTIASYWYKQHLPKKNQQ